MRQPLFIDLTPWRRLWRLLDRKERRDAIRVALIAVLAAGASTVMVGSVMPFLSVLADADRIRSVPQLAWAYRTFGFQSDYGFLLALGLAALLVIVLAMAIQLLRIYAVARFAMMRLHSFSCRLIESYLGQPYEYFLDHHSGDLSTRVLGEAQEVVMRFLLPATEFVTAVITILALLGFLFAVDPVITLASLAALGGTYGITYGLTRMRLKRLGSQRADMNARRYRIAAESFGGVKDIKLLGREGAYVDRFSAPSFRMADALAQVQVLSQMPFHIIQTVALAGVILICFALLDPAAFAGNRALPGILPILGVFAFAGQRLMPELGRLYRSAATIQFGRAAIDAIYDDLMAIHDQPPLAREMPAALGLRQTLQIADVSYRYPSAEAAGISGIALTIHAGEKIGVVGGTGAGKTTLADVILGLLRPQAGRLLADGVAVTGDNIRAWQQTVGYVPQEIFLSDATISENIALGVPAEEVDPARVLRAARAAQIDDFVREELARGYDTRVGERGVRLSGGQRQRIGIARALYHDADLIVFDEATSALDNLTEAEVMEAIDALPGDKTVLMIAHRLSTVRGCDRIIVMEKGRVVGCGDWDSLLRDNLAFQRIARVGAAAGA